MQNVFIIVLMLHISVSIVYAGFVFGLGFPLFSCRVAQRGWTNNKRGGKLQTFEVVSFEYG